jgi:tRNA/rRNA methyltransferase
VTSPTAPALAPALAPAPAPTANGADPRTTHAPLTHVTVVLVRPQQSGNVGAAARAIANHGLGRLILVDPPAFDPEEARWMAPHARHVIDELRLVGSVAEAVADRARVVGTSGRGRKADTPVWGPGELAQVVADGSPTAVLFGPEDAGLSNEDLERCEAVLSLPTEAAQPSLNLGQAVTVTGSWLLAGVRERRPDSSPPLPPNPAPIALRDAAVRDVMEVLEASGYLASRNPSQVRATLHRAMSKLSEDARDVAVLRGMLKPVRHRLRNE